MADFTIHSDFNPHGEEIMNPQAFFLDERFKTNTHQWTKGIRKLLTNDQARSFIRRHAKEDWGLMKGDDAAVNSANAKAGRGAIISIYDVDGVMVWVRTNGDHTMTTILLEEEV